MLLVKAAVVAYQVGGCGPDDIVQALIEAGEAERSCLCTAVYTKLKIAMIHHEEVVYAN